MECVKQGKLTDHVLKVFLPLTCSHCSERFSDGITLDHHTQSKHRSSATNLVSDPASMSRSALIAALRQKGLDTRGNIATLRERLYSVIF